MRLNYTFRFWGSNLCRADNFAPCMAHSRPSKATANALLLLKTGTELLIMRHKIETAKHGSTD